MQFSFLEIYLGCLERCFDQKEYIELLGDRCFLLPVHIHRVHLGRAIVVDDCALQQLHPTFLRVGVQSPLFQKHSCYSL